MLGVITTVDNIIMLEILTFLGKMTCMRHIGVNQIYDREINSMFLDSVIEFGLVYERTTY